MEYLMNKIDELKADYKYKEARELLEKIENKCAQSSRELAECYYKDLELHRDFSYEHSLEILNKIVDDKKSYKTLQLKGAIYKRKWEYKKNINDLYISINYYKESFEEYMNLDEGYGGINAAYLYDILADNIRSFDNEYSEKLIEKANKIRRKIVEIFSLKLKNKWIYHTVSQAHLGLGEINECKSKLQEASEKHEYKDWEIFTTYKQMKFLSELKGIKELDFLNPLLKDRNSDILSLSLDKKGLALSGGGFRASFFHLGTLAKLAECDILKDIEVISTVSGGSIVGVLYYLKLQKLLEEKFDIEIKKEDYINLVDELIDEFYEVVQSDIRNSVITEKFVSTTLFKVLNPFSSYSRTNKLGDIYQERFYSKYQKYMKDLIITPKDWNNKNEKFKPRFNNWNRKNKVPIIVINATNLNSGHVWQFQATKMGEPEYMTDLEIDKNNRFDWVRYDSKGLKKEFKNYLIGQAVACSSAVPILFTPIVLKDLYEGYKLSISDGGIYDNQGFSGLLSEECDYIICSDASGQMDNQINSHTTVVKTNMRTIDIQMDRNREQSYEEIRRKADNKVLKGFLFTHLKEGIESKEIASDEIKPLQEEVDFQKQIANIRTDLDTFSKIEAYSLMFNGYELFKKEVVNINQDLNKHNWVFLKYKDKYEKDDDIKKELSLSKYQFTRRFRKWIKGE